MILDRKKSLEKKEIKWNKENINFIHVTRGIAITLSLVLILSSCAKGNENTKNIDTNSISVNEIDNNYISYTQIDDLNGNFEDFRNRGTILISNNNKYSYYRVTDLIVMKSLNSSNNNYNLIDIRLKDKDILTNEKVYFKSIEYENLFINTSLIYNIYIDNKDCIDIINGQQYLKIDKNKLSNYVNNWDNNLIIINTSNNAKHM